MKVAIASVYYYENYGSMLQAYATQKVLDKMGIENETINIDGISREINNKRKRYFIFASFTSGILFVKVAKLFDKIHKKFGKGEYVRNSQIRKEMFVQYKKEKFRLTKRTEKLLELSVMCSEYDAVIVGSDQLWLPVNIAADFFTLSFVPDGVKRISYATSFGQSKLPRHIKNKARKFLGKFDAISVRENTGKKIVEELTNKNASIVCDPTMLLSKTEWLENIGNERVIEGKYIFCYFLGRNKKHRDYVSKLKKNVGVKIVAIPHADEYVRFDEKYSDVNLYAVGPKEFLSLINNAEYICTDSFHATVFSILFHKKFFCFKRYRKENIYSTNNRIESLLDYLGIKERIISVEDCDGYDLTRMNIDYEDVDNRINKLKSSSLDFIKNSLLC
ncbi:MAG: polysaccharide pyruvyl transferase family protein [Clostridium sp.]|nr:polysaccharide pyruvyl transferase family protein [Clostridium sp.]